jgi:hypothetical protein
MKRELIQEEKKGTSRDCGRGLIIQGLRRALKAPNNNVDGPEVLLQSEFHFSQQLCEGLYLNKTINDRWLSQNGKCTVIT